MKKYTIEELVPDNEVIQTEFKGIEFYRIESNKFCVNASAYFYVDTNFSFVLIVEEDAKANLDYFCGFEYLDDEAVGEIKYKDDYIAYIYKYDDDSERIADLLEEIKDCIRNEE
jgi:hypothetical protein